MLYEYNQTPAAQDIDIEYVSYGIESEKFWRGKKITNVKPVQSYDNLNCTEETNDHESGML